MYIVQVNSDFKMTKVLTASARLSDAGGTAGPLSLPDSHKAQEIINFHLISCSNCACAYAATHIMCPV